MTKLNMMQTCKRLLTFAVLSFLVGLPKEALAQKGWEYERQGSVALIDSRDENKASQILISCSDGVLTLRIVSGYKDFHALAKTAFEAGPSSDETKALFGMVDGVLKMEMFNDRSAVVDLTPNEENQLHLSIIKIEAPFYYRLRFHNFANDDLRKDLHEVISGAQRAIGLRLTFSDTIVEQTVGIDRALAEPGKFGFKHSAQGSTKAADQLFETSGTC